MEVALPTEKYCKGCDTIKPANTFSVVNRKYKSVSGVESIYVCLQSSCKSCMAACAKKHAKSGYIRPSRRGKILNDHKEIAAMQRAPSWMMQKTGYEASQYKIYPTCVEGHKYVGPICLPCKYGILNGLVTSKSI